MLVVVAAVFSFLCIVLSFVGDTSRLSCESPGIPQKGFQIACVAVIYVNDVICKLA